MTTPPRAVSVLGVLTVLSLGAVLLIGSCEVPVPIALESATRVVAQVGTVTGRVTDASTGQPIAAAQVYIASMGLGGLSKQDGRYLLPNVPAGIYKVAVTRIGYRTTEVQVTIGGSQTVEQNFSIAEEALQLDAIVVSGTPGGTQWNLSVDRVRVANALSDDLDNVDPTQSRIAAGLSGPIFTPMVVRPEIRNLPEVQEALMREYPPLLADDGAGGQVVVWVFITEEGRVLDRRVAQSSGQTRLDEAALELADVLRFSPALNRNERIQVWVQLPIMFEAQD